VEITDVDLAEPGLQPDCAVTEYWPITESVRVPACQMTTTDQPAQDTPLPCWWVAQNPYCESGLEARYESFDRSGAWLRCECGP